jgi:hypothetical protein
MSPGAMLLAETGPMRRVMYYRSMPYFEVEQLAIPPAPPPARVARRRRWLLLVAALVLAPGAALLAPWI